MLDLNLKNVLQNTGLQVSQDACQILQKVNEEKPYLCYKNYHV